MADPKLSPPDGVVDLLAAAHDLLVKFGSDGPSALEGLVGGSLILVMGNQSADLDSMVSALVAGLMVASSGNAAGCSRWRGWLQSTMSQIFFFFFFFFSLRWPNDLTTTSTDPRNTWPAMIQTRLALARKPTW